MRPARLPHPAAVIPWLAAGPTISPSAGVPESTRAAADGAQPQTFPNRTHMKPPNDPPAESGDQLAEDLSRLNDWQDALAAMGQPAPCDDEFVQGPTNDDEDRSTP